MADDRDDNFDDGNAVPLQGSGSAPDDSDVNVADASPIKGSVYTSAEDTVRAEIEDAKQRARENLSGWQRTQADFDNFRRRTENESAEWIEFGKQAMFVKLLPVLDSFEQAMLHAPESADEKVIAWKNGLEGIVRQVTSLIKEMGIEKIDAIGKKFDPNMHEAVREVPAAEGQEEGTVAEQYQTGYVLKGKVLRPAQVAITKKVEKN